MEISGWGRWPRAAGRARRPEKVSEIRSAVRESPGTVLARGAGRSYGDAAMNPPGTVLLMERLNRLLAVDEGAGVVRCEAGVTIDDLLGSFVPRGWFPGVTPGTRFVTVGGAVAGDVHGKNHHRDGSFASFIRSLTLLTASGETITCSRELNRDAFSATLGGMGLTGVILEVELSLRRIETSYVTMRNLRAGDIDEVVGLLDQHNRDWQYSVAWIDAMAEGRRLGEGIVSLGNHAHNSELDAGQRAQPLRVAGSDRPRVPIDLPGWVINRTTTQLFNRIHRMPAGLDHNRLIDYDAFFYPLDRLHDWNRLYGTRGFLQYQCVVPLDGGSRTLRQLLEHCRARRLVASLGVVKRFGRQSGWLSFPMPGYTLSLDIPVSALALEALDELDEVVIHAGGRVNLGKDARLRAAAFRAMYPEYRQWQAAKATLDPGNRFTSALARRLELTSV
jgi:decaprenylphospho-beta-D-ribofuranose 2-oxidase